MSLARRFSDASFLSHNSTTFRTFSLLLMWHTFGREFTFTKIQIWSSCIFVKIKANFTILIDFSDRGQHWNSLLVLLKQKLVIDVNVAMWVLERGLDIHRIWMQLSFPDKIQPQQQFWMHSTSIGKSPSLSVSPFALSQTFLCTQKHWCKIHLKGRNTILNGVVP